MKDLFADYSGVPNDSSPGAVSANDAAIAAALADAVSGTGDGFFFDQLFYFSQPFTYPVESSSPNRPLHFGIRGTSPTAWMMFTGDRSTPTINISGTPFPSQYPGYDLVLWLEDFVLNNGGIYIYDCGKYLRTRNVHITGGLTGGNYALSVLENAGGSLEFNVHECGDGPGIYLESCDNVEVDLTARTCNGVGISMLSCAGLHGRLYGEANSDYNIQLADVSRSEFNYWMEAAHFGATKPYNMNQGNRIFCWGNTFFGQAQLASGTAWYEDSMSSAMNTDISAPQLVAADVGTVVNTTPMELHTPVNWSTAQLERSSDHLSLTVKSGAFDSTPLGSPRYVEFVESTGGTGLANLAYTNGDCLIFKFTVSSPDYAYLLTDNHPSIYMTMNYTNFGQSFWVNRSGPTEFVSEPIIFNASGTGIRIFAYYDTGNADQSTLTGPTQDYTITYSDIEVRYLSNPF